MKKSILMATTAIVAAGFAADASAVDVEMYGQVNKAVMAFDDGRDTEWNIVDNDNSSTRFGMKGSQTLDNGLTASVLFENEMQSNSSDAIVQNNTGASTTPTGASSTPTGSAATFTERHARVGLAGDWGAVFLGQMSTATDSVTEQDLAGVNDVLRSRVKDLGGSLFFRNSSTGAGVDVDGDSSVTDDDVAALANNFDGNGRQDAVRYDTPIFYGFQGRISSAQGGDTDAGLYYDGKIDAFAVKGALGYVAFNDGTTSSADVLESQWSGSVSVKHDMGVAATVAYGERSLDNKTTGNDDPSFYYMKLGYAWDAFEVAADYGQYDDHITGTTTDHELSVFGLGAQYNMGNGVSVSGFYRYNDLDITGNSNVDELAIYGVNMRVKF